MNPVKVKTRSQRVKKPKSTPTDSAKPQTTSNPGKVKTRSRKKKPRTGEAKTQKAKRKLTVKGMKRLLSELKGAVAGSGSRTDDAIVLSAKTAPGSGRTKEDSIGSRSVPSGSDGTVGCVNDNSTGSGKQRNRYKRLKVEAKTE